MSMKQTAAANALGSSSNSSQKAALPRSGVAPGSTTTTSTAATATTTMAAARVPERRARSRPVLGQGAEVYQRLQIQRADVIERSPMAGLAQLLARCHRRDRHR